MAKKQLDEAQEHQNKGDSKLTKVMQNLRILQDEKGSLEAKLGQKSVELQSQVCCFSWQKQFSHLYTISNYKKFK